MHTGEVQTFSTEMGIGVIRPDDGSPDVVVTIEAVRAAGVIELLVGQRLTYQIEHSEEGKGTAVNLIIDE